MVRNRTVNRNPSRSKTLRLGFVPLNDCAPIIIAQEKGFFADHGLSVSLHRELGWATVRDKVIYRELDAAHALAAMPMAATLGLGSVRADCVTAIVLNLNGNAITLSERLWKRGVRDGHSLREELLRLRHERVLTFGVVNRFSSHHHLLQRWFAAHRILPSEVRIVVLPPSQMESNLSCGNLDGFCVGEPWNSVAARTGSGWIVATSEDVDSRHPEKVLMLRGDFAEAHDSEHLALVQALTAACAFCDQRENAAEIANLLSRQEYIGAPAATIEAGLNGQLYLGHKTSADRSDTVIFHRGRANEPTLERAMWAVNVVRTTGACEEPSALNSQFAKRIFRMDLFERALNAHSSSKQNRYEEQTQLTA